MDVACTIGEQNLNLIVTDNKATADKCILLGRRCSYHRARLTQMINFAADAVDAALVHMTADH